MMKRSEEIMLAENNQFGAEMDHLSDCIINNRKPFSPGEEGLQDHIIMEAIYESAKLGRPVKVNGISQQNNWRGPEPQL